MPVLLMAGGNAGPDVTYSHPVQIDRLAARHPKLQIVSAHGSWPWVNELLGVAYRRTNVWVSPDMYLFLPGSEVLVDAANGFLSEQLLFGSSYPFRPIGQSIDDFLALGFKEDVIDRVLYGNAARLLGLGHATPSSH